MALDYEIVDVFTDRPWAGNPLAVVFDDEAVLDAERMQLVAREFNLSETVFVLPPVAGGDYRVRIFTPVTELPFAGHPSVGAAATLVRLGRIGAGDVRQECGAGVLPVRAAADSARLAGGTPGVGGELPAAEWAALLGLSGDDLAGPAPRRAGCGIDSVHLLVVPGALERVRLDVAGLRAADATVSVGVWDTAARVSRCRVFAPDLGVPEDPATGSAALAHGVYLVAAGLLTGEGRHDYLVRQGAHVGRPSVLTCTVTVTDGAASAATVAGGVTPVAAGRITA